MTPWPAVTIRPMDHPFEATVERYSRRLFAIAIAMLRDAHDAEDAVQETMVVAWKGWSKTAGHDDPFPWLMKICVNHCLSRGSTLRLRRHRTTELDSTFAAPERLEPDPRLAAAYEDLSRQQRAVVILHYHFGYSLDDCAEVMNCRPGTVRSHLSRALTTLREVMGNE